MRGLGAGRVTCAWGIEVIRGSFLEEGAFEPILNK